MNRKHVLTAAICCFAFALATTRAAERSPGIQASASQSSLVGVVTNAATGRALEGAQVVLGTTDRVTFTDQSGTYRFDDISPGSVQISISFTGMNPIRIPVEIAPGRNQRDVGLTSDIYKMDKFVVPGEREGNAQALTLQKLSAGVRDMISTDALGAFTGNPAHLIMRMAGVEGESVNGEIRFIRIRGLNQALSTVTIDGDRFGNAAPLGGGLALGGGRDVQWHTVGSDAIERIELVKSPTPDMDGDSIGGAVNLVSKSAFDSSRERRIRVTAGGIWRAADPRDNAQFNTGFNYSEVFAGKLGVSINAVYRGTGASTDGTTASREMLDNSVRGPAYEYSFLMNDSFIIDRFTNYAAKIDYKLSDSTTFSLSSGFTKSQEHNADATSIWTANQVVATRDPSGALTGVGAIVPGYTDTFTEIRPVAASTVTARSFIGGFRITTRTLQFKGVHRLDNLGLNIDYTAYDSKSKSNYDGNTNLDLRGSGFGYKITGTDSYHPTLTQLSGPDWTKISSYTQVLYGVNSNAAWDNFQGAALNVKEQFKTPVPSYIKTGFRFREEKRQTRRGLIDGQWTYVGPDGISGTADDNPGQFGQLGRKLHGKLDSYPVLPWPAIQAPGNSIVRDIMAQHPEYFLESVAANLQLRLQANRNFKEDISAYYLMGNVALGKLSILGGFRVETTKTKGKGSLDYISPAEKALRAAFVGPLTNDEIRRRTNAEFANRQTRTGEYRNVLPGLHFKYEPIPDVIARLSYSTNIGRPNILQLIPQATADDAARTISTSNPNLKPQTANNFDFSVQYYLNPAGQLSAGVFLKEMKNFIYTLGGQSVGTGPDNGFGGLYEGYLLTSQANGGFARVKGLELSYSQQFTHLPGFWSGFGAFANYTRLQMEGNYGAGSAIALQPTSQIAGFNPLNGNLGVSYIRNRLTVRLQGNYRGRYLLAYSTNASRLQYARVRVTLDIKTAYELSKTFGVYLDVNNVFGEPDRERDWNDRRPMVYAWFAPQFLFGINVRL